MNKSSAADKSLGFRVKTESPKPFRHPNTLELTRSLIIHPRLSFMITSSRAFVKHFSYIFLTFLIFFSNDREADGGCEGRLFVPVLRELFRGNGVMCREAAAYQNSMLGLNTASVASSVAAISRFVASSVMGSTSEMGRPASFSLPFHDSRYPGTMA